MKYLTHIRIIAVAFVLVVATFLPSVAQTTTIRRVVASPMGATQDGSSWENAMTLQAALRMISLDDQVWIAGGTYKPHADDKTVTFSIRGRNAQIYGGFAGTETAFDPATNDTRPRNADGTFINETILSGDLSDDDGIRPAVVASQADKDAYNATRDDNSYTVVTILVANVVLNGLTITSGERGTSSNLSFFGGGLYSNPTATNISVTACTFTNNRASTAGGGAFFSKAATLTDCTFTGNSRSGAQFAAAATLTGCTFTNNTRAGNGGGAFFFSQASTLTGCTFTNNTASGSGAGGGVYFTSNATATLTDCTFTGNTSPNSGGGAYFLQTATLTNCAFTNNETTNGDGGGAYFSRKATLTNCVYANNTATVQGGGIELSAGGTVINSTFYNNMTTAGNGKGGGIWVNFGDADASMPGTQTVPFTLQNSLFMGNTTANDRSGHQVYVSNGSTNDIQIQNNLIEGGTTGIVYVTSGPTDIDTVNESDAEAVFASTNAADVYYLRLVTGSPALNVGNNDYVNNASPPITTDAVGATRIQASTVDLGAYEGAFAAPIAQVITFTSDDAGDVGTDIDLVATAGSGLDVTFEITGEFETDGTTPAIDGTVATLSGDGTTLSLIGIGKVEITATQAGTAIYAVAMQTQTLSVSQGTQTIAFTSDDAGDVGTDITLEAMGGASGLPVTFEINEEFETDGTTPATDGTVATLSGGNNLTLVGVGKVEITATQAGNANYAATTQAQILTVSQGMQTIAFTSDDAGAAGTDIDLVATASSGLDVTFMITGGTGTATLANGSTTLSLTGVGTVEITATQAGNANYAAATQTQTITVSQGMQTLMFTSPAVGTINTDIELTVTASSGLAVTFAVTNQSPTSGSGDVATLADNGTTLSLIGAGTVTITATQAGDANYAATTQTQIITVSAIPLTSQTIMFTTPTAAGQTGTTITLTATATSMGAVTYAITEVQDADGNVVTGADAVAILMGTTLTLVAPGTVTITASQVGGDIGGVIYAPATQTQTITVTDVPPTPQTIAFTSPGEGPTNSTITLAATATSMGTVTFAITEVQDTDGNVVTGGGADAVATLAGTTLTLVTEGTVTVTASQAGGDISGTIYVATTQTQVITITSIVLGIEDAPDGFVLYPNPTSGKLHFSEQVAEFPPLWHRRASTRNPQKCALGRPLGTTRRAVLCGGGSGWTEFKVADFAGIIVWVIV